MSENDEAMSEPQEKLPLTNGPGAAALLAGGIGVTALGIFAVLGDTWPAFKKLMIFYTPTGPLSGVTATAIAVWLLCWIGLDVAWKRREMRSWWIGAGLGLTALSFVLMFPPVGDLF